MKAPGVGDGGKDAIKPYNPISSNKVLGSFELLVKVYAEGTASAYAGRLQPGDRVSFKQVAGNIKPFRYPFSGVERLTMLAVGTGIAPMLQALWPLLETPGDATRVRLLYGNKSPDDIMLKATLDERARARRPLRGRVRCRRGRARRPRHRQLRLGGRDGMDRPREGQTPRLPAGGGQHRLGVRHGCLLQRPRRLAHEAARAGVGAARARVHRRDGLAELAGVISNLEVRSLLKI